MKAKIFQLLSFLSVVSITSLISCEDVINVDLQDALPRLVVEGKISNLSSSIIVNLTKSTDYFKPSGIVSVENATVYVSSSTGAIYQLPEGVDGRYSVNRFVGKPGESYTLQITTDGIQYSATSKMPFPVRIEGLSVDKRPGHHDENRINVFFMDPEETVNYYQVKIFRNDALLNNDNHFILSSDKYYNGKYNSITINAGRLDIPQFEVGDTIKVQLISIDKMMYDYYQILHDITDGGNVMSASTPSNPLNNISNGALGYFAAFSVSEKILIVK